MSFEAKPQPAAAPAAAPPSDPAVEEHAWAEVVLAWDDPGAHRAYLARFGDLAGLALAGRRYRAVLIDRPDDPMAARFRDEVVKRATVQGLAQLPRTTPPTSLPRWVKFALISALSSVATAVIWKLFTLFTAPPVP
jgi:hypothetical protein